MFWFARSPRVRFGLNTAHTRARLPCTPLYTVGLVSVTISHVNSIARRLRVPTPRKIQKVPRIPTRSPLRPPHARARPFPPIVMLASTARATRAIFAPSPARARGRRRADARAGLLDHWRPKSNDTVAAATSATNGDGVVARDDAVASLERSMAKVSPIAGSDSASARQVATRRPVMAGNWKLNPTTADAAKTLAALVGAAARDGGDDRGCDVFVCPPAPFIADVARTVRDVRCDSRMIDRRNSQFYPKRRG